MTGEEWDKIVAVIAADWPHSLPPDEALAKWAHDLDDLPGEEVLAAVEAIYRDGREFPPNGGQIRAKVIELSIAAIPDFEDAFALAMHAATSVGEERGLDWLREREPLVAEAAERFPWRSLCREPMDDGTRRAQFREIFKALRAKTEKAERYKGLPAVRPRQLAPKPMREIMKKTVAELEPGKAA